MPDDINWPALSVTSASLALLCYITVYIKNHALEAAAKSSEILMSEVPPFPFNYLAAWTFASIVLIVLFATIAVHVIAYIEIDKKLNPDDEEEDT